MIKEIKINSMDELMVLFSEQNYNKELDRNRCHYLYRGMSDRDFKLETSLYRNCKDKQRELEPHILRNFTKYAELENPMIKDSVWNQMILGQHHSLPTRLLDWSHSSIVALQFAVTENDLDDMEKHDCIIWRIDMPAIHRKLEGEYKKVLNENKTTIFTVDMLNSVAPTLEQYDEDMGDMNMCILEPPSIDRRIVNQYSFFSVVPMAITDVEDFLDKHSENTVKYIIDSKLRWPIRDMLDHMNISERLVYPGLDGLSKWLGRHYYVKPDFADNKSV